MERPEPQACAKPARQPCEEALGPPQARQQYEEQPEQPQARRHAWPEPARRSGRPSGHRAAMSAV